MFTSRNIFIASLRSPIKMLRKPHNKSMLLGRWGTVTEYPSNRDNNEKIIKSIDKNCDWANHDHCGGELCSIPEKNIAAECTRISTNKEIKGVRKLREEDIVEDTLVYLII